MSVFSYRCTKGSSDKFWRIERGLLHTIVEFGRVGTNGQRIRKDYDQPAQARAAATALIAEKVRKGYRPVKYGETVVPKRAPKAAKLAKVKTLVPLPPRVAAKLAQRRIAPHAVTIQKLALPSIRLLPKQRPDARIPVGASKVGGQPDLPPGVAWPTLAVKAPAPSEKMVKKLGPYQGFTKFPPAEGGAPLSFIAQIRLADVARHDKQQLLPKRGMLYFFYCDHGFDSDGKRTKQHWDPGGGWSESEGVRYSTYRPPAGFRCRVIHFDGDLGTLRRSEPPEPNRALAEVYKSFAVGFAAELTLPQAETVWVDYAHLSADAPLRLESDDWEAYRKMTGSLRRCYRVAQMLGHPDQAQPYALEHAFSDARKVLFPAFKKTLSVSSKFHLKSRLLLQIGNSVGHGTPSFFGIRLDDLGRGNFSRVWVESQR